ncbi:MAG TPA: hypothetical protein VIJ14_04155 [Rhabdochlamydiaceae bacterium]
MSSVNKPQASGFIGNVVSFAQDHLFSSRHSSISKLAVLALTVGVGYVIVQRARQWFATAAPATAASATAVPQEKEVTDLFFRVTGKNIPPNCPVYLLGTDERRSYSQYPKNIVQEIAKCQVLVSTLPMFQARTETVRAFVTHNLTLTLEKLKQRDEAWFRSQFTLIGYSGQYLEEQMELVRKAQTVNLDVTLSSWQDKLPAETLVTIQERLMLGSVYVMGTHPLIIMHLLGNELDLDEQVFDRMELGLAQEMEGKLSYIELEETDIMAANLIHQFVGWLAHFNNDETDDYIQKIQIFCKRLETGYYLDDEESLSDYEHQPRLYQDRFIIKKGSKDEMVTLQSTIVAKNLAWRGPIFEALQQNKSTAIVIPKDNINLDRKTGMLNFLRSQGYTVELV